MTCRTKNYYPVFTFTVLLAMMLIISGCAGTSAALTKRDLNVQTKMSSTIFLEPVQPSQKVAYVQVRNTSGQSGLSNIQSQIEASLLQKGYKITQSPNDAHFIIQANVLQAGEVKPGSQNSFLSGGFGGALQGAALGGAIGALTGPGDDPSTKNTIGGVLAGAAVGAAVNSLWKDKAYAVTTDVQISQKTKNTSKEQTTSNLKQGDSGVTKVTSSSSSNWQRYQTRIVSYAEKVNLKFEDAEPVLAGDIANSIAGLF